MEFSYKLRSIGWADVYLRIGNSETFIEPSYLSEPLIELVRALETMLPECTPADEVSSVVRFDWNSEPAIHSWKMERAADTLRIEITLYADGIKALPGEIVFNEICELDEFIEAVVSAMDLLLSTHGLIGYRKQWNAMDFPISSYLKLKYYLINTTGAPTNIINPDEWNEQIITSINDELKLLTISLTKE